MFQEFPYSDMHQLNLDWIIKIAKDFLDQYTHLQELITNGEASLQTLTQEGLDQLQDKADTLEGLLQTWYDTHSEDIQDQLTQALADLNEWYNTHEAYLDQTLVNNIAYFGTRAEAKMEECLAQIPVDYSTLAETVETIKNYYDSTSRIPVIMHWEQGSFNASGNLSSDTRIRTDFIETTRYSDMIVSVDSGYLYELDRYAADYTLLETISWNNNPRHINLENTKYIRFILCNTGGTNIIPSEGIHLNLTANTPLYDWKAKVDSEFIHKTKFIDSTNLSDLPDANNAEINGYYFLDFQPTDTLPAHLPFEHTVSGVSNYCVLVTLSAGNQKWQYLFDREMNVYSRLGVISTSGWFSWHKNSGDSYLSLHYCGYVTSGTMATVLDDANNATPNGYYLIRFTEGETDILPNLPFTSTKQGETDFCYLLMFANDTYQYQILFTRASDVYTRLGVVTNNAWFGWTKNSGDKASGRGETIHVGASYEYTKLTDALKYAFEHQNTTVIVHPGIYNIIDEMGASYWENFTDYSDLTHAKIGNGMHLIFSPDSYVYCLYSGNNMNVHTMYSPFNCLDGAEGDFTIEGLVLRVSGCRYAIHDDVGASLVEQTHKYINCDISNENRCIGAGLGANMNAEMRDCIFRSTGQIGNNPVSWHNSGGGTTGKCSIILTGCYITGNGSNTAQFLAYGSSQKQSRVMVSNNRFTAEPVCRKYDSDQPYMNFEMIAFNNQID